MVGCEMAGDQTELYSLIGLGTHFNLSVFHTMFPVKTDSQATSFQGFIGTIPENRSPLLYQEKQQLSMLWLRFSRKSNFDFWRASLPAADSTCHLRKISPPQTGISLIKFFGAFTNSHQSLDKIPHTDNEQQHHDHRQHIGHITAHKLLDLQSLAGIGLIHKIIPAPALLQGTEQDKHQ